MRYKVIKEYTNVAWYPSMRFIETVLHRPEDIYLNPAVKNVWPLPSQEVYTGKMRKHMFRVLIFFSACWVGGRVDVTKARLREEV